MRGGPHCTTAGYAVLVGGRYTNSQPILGSGQVAVLVPILGDVSCGKVGG